MKRKKERSRATHVADDNRKRRLHLLFKVCAVLLLPTLYLFYSLSGLYLVDVEISNLKEQIIWCLLHPLKVYNDKSYSMVLVGGLLWILDGFFWNGKHQSCHVCVIKIHIGKRKTI